jgi:hypothetical protein
MSEIIANNLINLISESDSNDVFDELLLLYLLNTRKKLWKSNLKKKKPKNNLQPNLFQL